MKTKKTVLIMQNRVFGIIGIVTAGILSIPLIAMRFTSEVDWKIEDFLIMGILIFGTGFLFVQVARVISPKYRMLVATGFLIALLIAWVHLAVGIVDSWPLAGS